MSKITLLWFTDPNKPFKVLSFKKITIYLILGSLAFFCLTSLTLFYSSLVFHNKLVKSKVQKNELHEKLKSYKNDIDKLKYTISSKNASIRELEKKLSHSQKQLQQIQKMESKIRNYLGLETKYPNNRNQSHQGAFKYFNASKEFNTGALIKKSGNSTRGEANIVKYSLSVKDNIRRIVARLREEREKLDNIPSILPVRGEDIWLSCDYEWRKNPFTSKKEFHTAIDIAGSHKTPIIAPADGRVVSCGYNKLWGKFVRIEHNEDLSTAYGHLYSREISQGEKVKRRDVIGYMGSTGHSTGTHLHYKVIKNGKHTDPKSYVLDRRFNSLKLKEKYEKAAN